MRLTHILEARYHRKFDIDDKNSRKRLRHKIRGLVQGRYDSSLSDNTVYGMESDMTYDEIVDRLTSEFGNPVRNGPGYYIYTNMFAAWDLGPAGTIHVEDLDRHFFRGGKSITVQHATPDSWKRISSD